MQVHVPFLIDEHPQRRQLISRCSISQLLLMLSEYVIKIIINICFIVTKTSTDVSLPKHWRASNQDTGLRIHRRAESRIFLRLVQRLGSNWKELGKS